MTLENVQAAKYLANASYYDFMQAMVILFIVVLAIVVFLVIFRKSRSAQHRERVTDLYVIGMIRKFADKDGISLEKEMLELKNIWKLERMSRDKLDKTVELELQERLTKEIEEHLEKDK